ncbi:type II toxin-antitoxin system VapC family toxin [Candidatus Poribacteria bacterium]|nr:type II toxin-antitoxin system VapC family toxin [Candidatus Poribacteria bacterium]
MTPKITGLKDVAVDTNALVAQVDARDKWHAKVHGISSKLRASGYTSVYFDCVINETISILGRRTEEQGRPHDFISTLSNLQNKVPKPIITWVSQETQRLYDDIVALVEQTSGKLNFHDALIALCCKESGIRFILSFDKDFDDINWLTRIEDERDIPV